ncbi:zinc-finger associated domain (zf-AD) domain-containing protein [Phthorimaea operculella]|nr:zinc-finger associated domain (zf-AD) domain-containing protein [Phthorimaea operculella]
MKTKTECRVCLKDGGTIPIFGGDDKPDISLEVAIFGNIQLDKEDEFPKALCKACSKLLDNAISFRKSALRADVVLKRRRQKGLSSPSRTVKQEANNDDYTTPTNVPKPDFLIVTTAENDIEIKDEYLSDEILLDDGGSCFDVDDNKTNLIDCNKKEENIERCDYECAVCSQYFPTLEEYEWHQQSLAHIKNCSKGIKDKPNIKVEEGTAVKDQKCIECDKSFTVNQYKKHMRVMHKVREERPTKTKECPVCKKLFRPDYLARHKRAVHGMDVQKSDEPPKLTVECPVSFGYRQGLMKHQRKVHKRAKGLGRAKATYLKLQEEEILQQQSSGVE